MSTWPTSDTDSDLVATDVSADSCSPARARNSLLLPLVSRFNNLKALVNSIIAYGDPKVIPPGRLLKVTKYAATGASSMQTFTFTPQAATNFLIVEVQGAGGAGCMVHSDIAYPYVSHLAGFGGGAGAYCKALITSGFSSVTVSVGPGGLGGGNGPTASFGSLVQCLGGLSNYQSSTAALPVISGCPLGSGSAITLGPGCVALRSVERVQGMPGVVYSTSLAVSGAGADSPMGAGAPSKIVTSGSGSYYGLDAPSNGYGAGGSGAVCINVAAYANTPMLSSSGSSGCVIVYEFS